MRTRRLLTPWLTLALLLALGGPAGLLHLHRGLAHAPAGGAAAAAHADHDHAPADPPAPASPERGGHDCPVCHALAHASALPPAPAAAALPAGGVACARLPAPEAVHPRITRDRPPGRGPPAADA